MDKYDTTVTDIAYGDAETRGQLRMWKKKLARDYAQFCAAYANKREMTAIIVDMIKKGKEGRQRALEKLLKAFGPGAVMEQLNLEQGKSLAIWSILKPRSSVTIEHETDDPAKLASLAQDCVTVNYIVAGAHRGEAIIGEGLWTLEVPDHALGRAVERSRLLHPGKIIHDAHKTLLNLPAVATSTKQERSPYIKAGNGCFVGKLMVAEDASLGGGIACHVRVSTWLESSMLGPDQVPLDIKGEPGKCFGDTILRPRPLVEINSGELLK